MIEHLRLDWGMLNDRTMLIFVQSKGAVSLMGRSLCTEVRFLLDLGLLTYKIPIVGALRNQSE
jgi:hypothetical protein